MTVEEIQSTQYICSKWYHVWVIDLWIFVQVFTSPYYSVTTPTASQWSKKVVYITKLSGYNMDSGKLAGTLASKPHCSAGVVVQSSFFKKSKKQMKFHFWGVLFSCFEMKCVKQSSFLIWQPCAIASPSVVRQVVIVP